MEVLRGENKNKNKREVVTGVGVASSIVAETNLVHIKIGFGLSFSFLIFGYKNQWFGGKPLIKRTYINYSGKKK